MPPIRLLFTRPIRLASTQLAHNPNPTLSGGFQFPTSNVRSEHISTFSCLRAKETPLKNPFDSMFSSNNPSSSLFQEIQKSPELREALQRMANVVQQKLGKATFETRPSVATMMKLAQDQEFRAASEDLIKLLQAKGFDTGPMAAMSALNNMNNFFSKAEKSEDQSSNSRSKSEESDEEQQHPAKKKK